MPRQRCLPGIAIGSPTPWAGTRPTLGGWLKVATCSRYAGHRFPLGAPMVKEMLGAGGIMVSHEPGSAGGSRADVAPVLREAVAPGRGRHPDHLLEGAAEGRLGRVADLGGDGRDVGPAAAQEPRRDLHPPLGEVL